MSMERIRISGVIVLAPRYDRLVSAQADLLRKSLRECLQETDVGLVLDLESVHLLDSIILGVVVGIFRDLEPEKRMVLCCASPPVASLLKLTHLDKILKPRANRQEAVEAIVAAGRKQS